MSQAFPLRVVATSLLGAGVVVALLLVRWVLGTLRPKGFPPGPPIIPGLGNLHQMPIQKPYLKFHQWAQQYGDIVGLKTGTGNLVLLNTPELVHELFDKRGAICSDRPVNHILTKHVFSGPEERSIAILQYDEYYRRWRKSFQFILGQAGIKRLLPLLESEAASLCRKFLVGGGDNSSNDYERNLRHWALAVPLVATTGERLSDMPADYADKVCHSQEELLGVLLPGAAPPVDIFPVLKYVPEFLGAKWKAKARYARKLLCEDANNYLVGAKKTYGQIEKDPESVGFDSLLPRIMKEQAANNNGLDKNNKFTATELAYVGQAAVGAAVDTTLSTFKNLMVAFAAFPETLLKAQEEIDRVAGGEPLSGERLGELVYLKACMSEVLRWRPTTPQALPHVLTRDETLGPYFFPKGTMFIANAWTIHRNEDEYDRPHDFIPERFLDNPFGLRPSITATAENFEKSGRRALYAFGSGRRQCPGNNSLSLWAYDIRPPPGGKFDVSVETGFKDGTVTEPIHPEVLFTARSEKKRAGVVADAERTREIARDLLGLEF
ncbi:cytochrome P450 [Apiospora marii]|uniref:Cytochrome P450 n=1 Tax=Apiospora marii TaxID=335849 RepID=A0ABR1RQA2_9PEZI